jgi:hypothetical protein
MTPEQFAAKLRTVGQVGVARAVGRALVATALIGEGEAKARAPVLSGHLRRSIAGKVRQGPEGPEAVISAGGRVEGAADVVYAGVMERGATITPKRGKFLRIPLGPAKTQAGLDRYPTPLRVSGAGLFFVRARPFLRPGAEEAARRLPAQFAKHLKAEIDAVR